MGPADFDLTNCEIHKFQEVTLHLEDGEDEDLMRYEGRIVLDNLFKYFLKEKQEKENSRLHNCKNCFVTFDQGGIQ